MRVRGHCGPLSLWKAEAIFGGARNVSSIRAGPFLQTLCRLHLSLFLLLNIEAVEGDTLSSTASRLISVTRLSAAAMPIATDLQSPAPSTLPPPQTFDILPPLHDILYRLLLPRDSTKPSSPSPETASPISPKELGGAIVAITNRVQKAREAVRDLPGIEMSIEQQQDVMEELEAEVRRLEAVTEGIREKVTECLDSGGTAGGDAMEEV